MRPKDLYAAAVNSDDLGAKPTTPGRPDGAPSAPEVLGAYALADRTLTRGSDGRGNHVRPAPLAVPLARLLEAGDERAAYGVVLLLSGMALRESYRLRIKVTGKETNDMARAVLGWFRAPRCTWCGGHGRELIAGTPHLSEEKCHQCQGSGERPFLTEFHVKQQPLAAWMREEVEYSLGRAGPQAMKHLAERMKES